MLNTFRTTWRKNAPELIAALTRGLPDFVMNAKPQQLAGIPVFCYHDISRTEFESHLRFLRENDYQALTADELLAALKNEDRGTSVSNQGARRLVITFDDGLQSLFETVFPLLREYDIRVVAFIAPAFHAQSVDRAGDMALPRLPVCSWRQIERLHESGLVDFQSHTLEHRLVNDWPTGVPLTGMTHQECEWLRGPALALADDFVRSREEIERRLGKRVRHMAFPQYNGSASAIQAGRASGYEAFYWGVRPWKAINRLGDDLTRVVRLSGEFLPRLPGRGRTELATILRGRYGKHAGRWLRDLGSHS
jgi:peptidoglycan/xylan/chitin deacetylase (PgdA/CDA1 family)